MYIYPFLPVFCFVLEELSSFIAIFAHTTTAYGDLLRGIEKGIRCDA